MTAISRISTFLAFLLVAVSCGPGRRLPVTDQRDSVSVVIRDSVIFRDSVVLVPLPPEKDKAVLPDTDTSRLKTCLAESDAWVAEGELHHTLRNRSESLVPISLKIPERLRSEHNYAIREVTRTVEVEKKFTHWQSFQIIAGRIVMIIAGLLLLMKIMKRFFRK